MGRVPLGQTSATSFTNAGETVQKVPWNKYRERATYLVELPLENFASGIPSTGAWMLKRVRIKAMLRKTVRLAKCLPGQILSRETDREDFSTVVVNFGPRGNQGNRWWQNHPPPTRPEYSFFWILDGMVKFPAFEKSFGVKLVRLGVYSLIVKDCPTSLLVSYR